MNKIELTAAEIQVIENQINGEIEIFTSTGPTPSFTATDVETALPTKVTEQAEELLDALEAYDELDGDLISWFYGKYKAQG